MAERQITITEEDFRTIWDALHKATDPYGMDDVEDVVAAEMIAVEVANQIAATHGVTRDTAGQHGEARPS